MTYFLHQAWALLQGVWSVFSGIAAELATALQVQGATPFIAVVVGIVAIGVFIMAARLMFKAVFTLTVIGLVAYVIRAMQSPLPPEAEAAFAAQHQVPLIIVNDQH